MDSSHIIEFTYKALMLVLILSLPPIIVASAVGILLSLIQAVTQIQEQTLQFGLKLAAVVITIVVTARWAGHELIIFTINAFEFYKF
ncbi:MAG: type III secretion system export apparatus subunit SctS [Desulfobacteraceae bacterium]|jgi:type III secretion HrpO family protein